MLHDAALRFLKGQDFMKTKQVIVVLAMLALAVPLAAQMGISPPLSELSGIWHPIVGSGGSYEMTDRNGKKSHMEITIVAKEDVNGTPGYWMEMAVSNPGSGGDMYVKNLISVADSGMTTSSRMVWQMPGQDPVAMIMTTNPAARPMPASTPSDIRDRAEVVGTETITVPAGTFICQHYRLQDGSSDALSSDVWISDKVAPWGLVRTQGTDSSMVLTKVITDAKDHITGAPKNFVQMMRERGLDAQVTGPKSYQGRPMRIKISGDVEAAQIVTRVEPNYPDEARRQHIEGQVVLHAIIGVDGVVKQLTVVSGPRQLIQSALEAVKNWRYRPSLLNGNPLEVDTTITVDYSL